MFVLLLTMSVAVRPAPAGADAAGVGGDFVSLPSGAALLDTRTGVGARVGVIGAAGKVTFPVLGVSGIPSTGVSAVLVRLVPVSATAGSYLRAYPDGSSMPAGSNLNINPGEQVSNTTVVRPGTNGRVAIYNSAGNTHVVATAFGYFSSSPSAGGGGFVPVAQRRIVDTRDGTGTTKAVIPANGTRTVKLTGGLVPAGAKAVVADVIVAAPTARGMLKVVPAGGAATSNSAFNFEPGGNYSHAVSLPLSTAGEVTVTNASAGTLNLIVSAYGYITADSTQGAGFRYIEPRRLPESGTAYTLSPNSTGALQVTGMGLAAGIIPIFGVAGIVANITVVSTAGGGVKLWPAGEAEPDVSQVHLRAKAVSALVVVKPGSMGKIAFKNTSSAPVRLLFDIQGYFSDPIPRAAVQQYSATVGVQRVPVAGAALGKVEYAYTDNIGRLLIGRQTDVDNFGSVQWTVESGDEAFTGSPSLSVHADGGMTLGVRHTNSRAWLDLESNEGVFWIDIGGPVGAPPAAISLQGGLALFAINPAGKLWVAQGLMWRALSDEDFVGTPVLVQTSAGVRLFLRKLDGSVVTAVYANGTLSSFTNLGGNGTTAPAVIMYPGYRLRVFAQQADGTIATKYQDENGVFPVAWTPLGTDVFSGAPAAILDPVLGRAAVVARTPSGGVMLSWETLQGSGEFGAWSEAIPGLFEQAATDTTIMPLTNSSGKTWVILFRNINNATRAYERQPVPMGVSAMNPRSTAAGGGFTAHTLPTPDAS